MPSKIKTIPLIIERVVLSKYLKMCFEKYKGIENKIVEMMFINKTHLNGILTRFTPYAMPYDSASIFNVKISRENDSIIYLMKKLWKMFVFFVLRLH